MSKNIYIIGKHAVEELFNKFPERFVKVFIARGSKFEGMAGRLEAKGIPVAIVPKNMLTEKVQTDSHQGIIALIQQSPYLSLKEGLEKFSSKEQSLLIMLDSIFDPHNVGAIFRAAECFGADAIIWSKNRGCPITAVVSKTSSGASELVEKIEVSNLADSAKRCREEGYTCVAAHLSEEAESLFEFTFPERTLLILGSEGKGVQPLLQKQTDHLLMIPMSGAIDSLNVSQAASVFLAFYASQRKRFS